MSKITAVSATIFCAASFLVAVEAPADQDDYVFRVFLAKPDGSDMKPLVNLPEYKSQGSAKWSQDGKQIAFDAYRPQMGEKFTDAKVIVVNADGSNPRVLGDGCMPCFSPRGNRIAYSRYNANQGVWVMSSAGAETECVLLDNHGWGTDWSPDGKRIVYSTSDRGGGNLVVYDLIEGTREPLFDADNAQYESCCWNFKWSPDGRTIAFKGQRAGGQIEVGIVDARGAKHGLVTRFEGNLTASFAFSPDGKRLLFSFQKSEPGSRQQLYSVDPNTTDPPEWLAGQDPLRANVNPGMSPDGKTLAFSSSKPAAAKKEDAKNR
jgi:TolB protein